MIYDYKITKLNGEKTLCLYFDLTMEFANLNSKKKKKKLITIIEDFIKNNKIKFNGEKIAIISGGLLIATLMFKAPLNKTKETIFFNETYPKSVIVLNDNNDILEDQLNTKMNKLKEQTEKTKNDMTENTTKESPKKQEHVNNKTTTKKIVNNQPPVETANDAEKQETKIENQIFVTIKRSNGETLKLELEEYVIGVVGAEMPASFHIEALKSQAVIARTYAINSLEKNKTLTDDSSTQNYKSFDELKSMWGNSFNTYYNKIKTAVSATKNIYLTYNGQTIEAVYHSTSNGTTEDAKNVWGNSFPYLISVSSPYDTSNSSFIKEKSLTYDILSDILGIQITKESDIQIISKTAGNRIDNISIDNNIFTGVYIRNTLGLRSADFDIEKTDMGLTFTTRGFGHGVGLSQYGANGLAKNGANYETILKHYYTGVEISSYL